jgi:flagellar biosynthesis protein FlhG
MLNSESVPDQAAGLRRIVNPEPVRVIAVTSGKGGVGKTNVSVNLAVAMAAAGKEVMLLDADLGLANVDVLLGLQPHYNLSHVLTGERSLEEVIVDGPLGIKIVPASSGVKQMVDLDPMGYAGIVRAFSELSAKVDVLIVDTAAGISNSVTTFVGAAQEVIVVVCDEPASITDAYAMIKVLNRDHDIRRFRILANMARSVREGYELFTKIARVCDKFLNVSLDFMGGVPHDEQLRLAVQKQRAVVEAYPSSRAALAFKKLAQKADNWPMPDDAGGQVAFFIERLIQARQQAETRP